MKQFSSKLQTNLSHVARDIYDHAVYATVSSIVISEICGNLGAARERNTRKVGGKVVTVVRR